MIFNNPIKASFPMKKCTVLIPTSLTQNKDSISYSKTGFNLILKHYMCTNIIHSHFWYSFSV